MLLLYQLHVQLNAKMANFDTYENWDVWIPMGFGCGILFLLYATIIFMMFWSKQCLDVQVYVFYFMYDKDCVWKFG